MILAQLLLKFEDHFKHFKRLKRSVFLLKIIFSNSLNMFNCIFESLKFLLKVSAVYFTIRISQIKNFSLAEKLSSYNFILKNNLRVILDHLIKSFTKQILMFIIQNILMKCVLTHLVAPY